ncbi:response regulator [Desulfonatronum sp. SC1]|uniref:response regulator n=1 Tax=Desulfonatronum sp. SC1 TaxID=2109626 RepID=UPI0018EE8199|nr:response regulator [Desulfonatronum sp. SC1]
MKAFVPDLILLDVMMPDMDGPTTMRELRKIPDLANTPVVFLTAKVQPQEFSAYLALGAQGVIAKPFDPMKLADEVHAVWEHMRNG